MTAGWDFAPACRPTVRRSPSPLGLGESHSFQRPVPKPPEPPVEAQSSQFNPSGSMSRKAGTGGARRHVDRRGRPRVRRAPEGGQDRGSSRRARTRPAGAPSAPERALRAIAAAKFDLGPRAREPLRRDNVVITVCIAGQAKLPKCESAEVRPRKCKSRLLHRPKSTIDQRGMRSF